MSTHRYDAPGGTEHGMCRHCFHAEPNRDCYLCGDDPGRDDTGRLEDAVYCEACEEDVTASPYVGSISGHWLCGSCARIEKHTGLRAEKGRAKLEATS